MSLDGLLVALLGFVVATGAGAMALVFVFELTAARWWRPFEAVLVGLTRGAVLCPLFLLPHPTWTKGAASVGVCALALGIRRVRAVPAPGLILLAFALTPLAWDTLMAREPGWVSDLYGLHVLVSGLTSALAVLAITASRLAVRVEELHALGRLLQCLVLVWAYLAFFQLLLIWLPDLPREVSFYRRRIEGPYALVAAGFALAHFVVPFFVLLLRATKRSSRMLQAVGAVVLGGGALHFVWLVRP